MTIDCQPATKSQVSAIQRHVDHNPNVTHKNTQIVTADRELNTYHRFYDDDDILQKHYGAWINDRNAKNHKDFMEGKISANRYEERSQTVSGFIAGNNGSKAKKAYTNIVVTPGSLETLPQLYKLLGVNWEMQKVGNGKEQHDRPTVIGDASRKKVKDFYDNYSVALAKHLNKSQTGMVITTAATNLDEGGVPHIHMGAVNMGVSEKTGKPVASLDAAILSSLPDNLKVTHKRHNKKTGKDEDVPSSKDNMSAWRDVVDNDAMTVFNHEISKVKVKSEDISLVRLGTNGSTTMAQYKAQKALEEQAAELEAQKKAFKEQQVQQQQ